MSTSTVLMAQARALVHGAQKSGLDARPHLQSLEAAGEAFHDPEARMSWDGYRRLWEEIAQTSGNPEFGLRLAISTVDTASAFGAVGFAARASATFRNALEPIIEFSSVLNEGTQTSLEISGDVAIIRDGPGPDIGPWPRHNAEWVMAAYLLSARAWTGCPVEALEVRFAHSAPSRTEEHHRLFGSRVSFGAKSNELRLPLSALSLPLRSAEPDLRRLLTHRAQGLRDELANTAEELDEDLFGRLERHIGSRLSEGSLTLRDTARALGVGDRTLQRRLGERGTSFRNVVEEIRHRQALDLLRHSQRTVAEISSMLGYSEPKAFRRAFVRWTGDCPSTHRLAAPS